MKRANTKEIPVLLGADLKRFWSKVDKAFYCLGACWEWKDAKVRGYGQFRIGNTKYLAHRVAYSLVVGKIPDDMCVLHRCDNPCCVNPSHLWIGTPADNARDRDEKGRTGRTPGDLNGTHTMPEKTARGAKQGAAKLTAANVLEIRERYAAGGCSHRGLASEYGVSKTNITYIVRRKSWRHI